MATKNIGAQESEHHRRCASCEKLYVESEQTRNAPSLKSWQSWRRQIDAHLQDERDRARGEGAKATKGPALPAPVAEVYRGGEVKRMPTQREIVRANKLAVREREIREEEEKRAREKELQRPKLVVERPSTASPVKSERSLRKSAQKREGK